MARTAALIGMFILTGAASAAAADLTLQYPAGGERWAVGAKQRVLWETKVAEGNARVAYSKDGGEWVELAVVPARDGQAIVTVPDGLTEKARLRVSLGDKPQAEAGPLTVVASQGVPSYAWKLIKLPVEFAPRDGAGALTFKDKMWFLGGWNPGDKKHFPRICNNEVWSSVDGATWTLEKPNTFLDRNFDKTSDWEGRHTAGYAVYKDKMWIIGGDCNQGYYQNDVWNTADGKKWTLVNADKPVPWGPRCLHYTVTFRDKIWVFGGQTMPAFGKADEIFFRDAWHTEDGLNWTEAKINEPAWSPRGMVGGSVVHNDEVWMLGGGTYDTPTTPKRNFYNDVWSSKDGVTWKQHLAKAPWGERQYHDVATFDGRMWVCEGYTAGVGNRKDVWYSADGVNWYEVPNTPWKPRHAASLFVHAGSLWMIAGNNMESDVWRLDPAPK